MRPKTLLALLMVGSAAMTAPARAGDALPRARPDAPSSPAAGDIAALVANHAARNGLPVLFAEAVIRKESHGDPQATGNGTIGLMQIKLSTARGLGYLGTADALYDSGTNLTWGMRYLGRAYQDAGGDICGAVMRYKTGHAAPRLPDSASRYCAEVKRMMTAN